ncbi:MAG: DNA polymerase IV [Deltaproteobacteria bacterium HGW-Deltaproteobacteria-21]|nr:MAG: DNA polymerase IV [Deltaproteobacteria bacterium HGW-Deltaproteobacteria-21]
MTAVNKTKKNERWIIHLDMDAFYPAVEVLDNPDLKGKPVIVGGSRKRGVVSSASYEARKFGVHSAQPIAKALRLCPHGIFLPVRMHRYVEISEQVFGIFHRFTPLVEPLSIDEAFLDVTGSTRLFGTPVEIARKIKDQVLGETGLTVSAGVAPSKFVAKIASDMEKPDGLTVVTAEMVGTFLDPLPVGKMWGVGKVTQEALARLNVRTFRDLRLLDVELLDRAFGKHGVKMHLLAMGIDERVVEVEHETKSIGHEDTYDQDIMDLDLAGEELLSLAHRVGKRLRAESLKGRTVTLKVKYSDFVLVTRSVTLRSPTDDGFEIFSAVSALLPKTEAGKRPVRLLGVSVSHLVPRGHEDQFLFQDEKKHSRKNELNTAMDSIQERFGKKGIGPARLFKKE